MTRLAVYAPATSANLSVGFDLLGLAVRPVDGQMLGDVVMVEDFPATAANLAAVGETALAYEGKGKFISKLSNDLENNLVLKAYKLFAAALKEQGQKVKSLKLTLYKNMPVGSGLGSSSSSVVATLVALNKFHGNPLSQSKMLLMMGELEGSVSGSAHYDNVAPSYLGGLQLMLPHAYPKYPQATPTPVKYVNDDPDQEVELTQALPIFQDWYWVLAYPGIVVRTEDARRILPDSYSRSQIIEQTALMGSFVHALYMGDQVLAANSLRDLVAEPYREQLLPNYQNLRKELYTQGALACGISGSGPTFYAVTTDLTTAHQLAQTFQEHYLQNDEGFIHICQVDMDGAVVLEEQELAEFLSTQS